MMFLQLFVVILVCSCSYTCIQKIEGSKRVSPSCKALSLSDVSIITVWTRYVVKRPITHGEMAKIQEKQAGICFHGKAADEILKLLEERKCKDEGKRPIDCGDIDTTKASGIYKVYPKGFKNGFEVYCDMDTDNGGWTVFQSRVDGKTDFYRGWKDYKKGFGNLKANFWLGNSKIHAITSQGKYNLRIDLEDFEKNKRHATYSSFSVGDEKAKYQLSIGQYGGNAGDSMSFQSDNSSFTTKDRDNDNRSSGNCAEAFKGGWWYGSCHSANLNGLYLKGTHKSYADGVEWSHWKGTHYSLKSTAMMIKRLK